MTRSRGSDPTPLAGSSPEAPPEFASQMTLIAESGGDSYLGQRHCRPHQLGRYPLGAQISHVVSDGCAEVRAERAGQMRRAYLDRRGDRGQAHPLPEARMDELLREEQPLRDAGVKRPNAVPTNRRRQHALYEAIDDERRKVIGRVDLPRDAIGIGGNPGVSQMSHRIEEPTERGECGRLRLHDEDTRPLSPDSIGVSLT